jgi:hypothetical protein
MYKIESDWRLGVDIDDCAYWTLTTNVIHYGAIANSHIH